MPAKRENPKYRERVYSIVRRIPPGRVMTYGQIAELLGEGYTPRTVGFVMHGSPDGTPWHRVLNAQGACSTGRLVLPHDKQQRMLEQEGVVFKNARCDLQTFLWIPKHTSTKKPEASLYKSKSSVQGRKR
ncbi:MAG TPA: MGMT family protein [Pyrinomonadaceae bacterium]|jgi:methylated-DNA-protein-cysteine methyltransferase-like protein|nr:MGMT family protein [Pyrinomonadaceae bacterium]